MADVNLKNLEADLAKLKGCLLGDPKDRLHTTWRYLQVYTQWGLKNPHTAEALKSILNTDAPSTFTFFDSAVDAYTSIHTACKQYLIDFDTFVKLGNDLKAFGKRVSPGEDKTGADEYVLGVIRELLQDGTRAAEAIELIDTLRDDAAQNAKRADDVAKGLTNFKNGLSTAFGKLETVEQRLEADDKTSQATIDKLLDEDPKNKESIAGITALLEKYQNEYEFDVKVASTSPTYCWVNIPFPPIPAGLIAAIVVSGIYGDRARKDKEAIDTYTAELKKANLALQQAMSAHGVQSCALNGVHKAKAFTETALLSVNSIQNVWASIGGGLETITTNLARCLKSGDNGERLAARQLVLIYLNTVEKAWSALAGPLDELTRDPYIVVESGTKPLDRLLKDAA